MKQTLRSEGDPCQHMLYHYDYGEEKHSAFHVNSEQNSTLKLDLRSREGKRRGKSKEKEQDRKGV